MLPPNINGNMILTESEKTDIKTKLMSIISSFVPNDDVPKADTFYITATYNKAFPNKPINGDTCEYLLKGVLENV